MNNQVKEDYEYHQNAKWDYLEQLKREHHDPFAGEETSEAELQEIIEQEKKAELEELRMSNLK